MKKWFIIIFIVFVCAIISMMSGGSELDKESQQYADSAIPAVITNWDMRELHNRESPELARSATPQEWEKVFKLYRKLGKLKSYNGSKGESNISLTTAHGKVISAKYVGNADFEAGPANITLITVKRGDQWQIIRFHVDSKAFLDMIIPEKDKKP